MSNQIVRISNCVWVWIVVLFGHGVSGTIRTLQEALPLSLQWWDITYRELFLGVIPPNENSQLPPGPGRQNTTFASPEILAAGKHVVQAMKWSAWSGSRPRHRGTGSSPMISACPRGHQEPDHEWTWQKQRHSGIIMLSQTELCWCQPLISSTLCFDHTKDLDSVYFTVKNNVYSCTNNTKPAISFTLVPMFGIKYVHRKHYVNFFKWGRQLRRCKRKV